MTIERIGRLSVAIGIVTILLGIPAIVLGHAELDTPTPADKSTVVGVPAEVVFTFTEAVKPANSSLKLVDAANKVVVEGSTVDAADPKKMHLALPADLAPGTYTVRWTTASAADGDLDHGTTTFTIQAAPSAPPSIAPSTAPSSAPSAAPSAAPASVLPSPSASAPPASPATSTSDAVIPVVIALIVLAGLGLWLLRGRARPSR